MTSTIEAERGVIGACLMDAKQLDVSLNDGCKPEWFTDPRCALVFNEFIHMQLDDEEFDYITILSKFDADSGVTAEFLEGSMDDVGSPTFCESYIGILKTEYNRRSVKGVIDEAYRFVDEVKPETTVATLSEQLADVITVKDTKTVGECMDDNIKVFEDACDGIISGIPLPYKAFSDRIGGLQRGSATLLIGRDGKGKSGVVAQCLDFWAGENISTLAFSFEDAKRRTLMRMAGCREWFSAREAEMGKSFVDGRYVQIDKSARNNMVRKMLKYKEFIDSKQFFITDSHMTAEEVCFEIKHHKRLHNIDVVTIDGFKDIIHSAGENETTKEVHVSKLLQKVAKDCDVGMLIVTHVHDVPDEIPLSARNLNGSKNQKKGARQVIIFQDAGVEGVDGESTFGLACTKSNYANSGRALLTRDERVFHYRETT